ncbi:MAG TPA: pyruvate dehydrogenase complex dihydrolipoamide acetyltransferase [Rubricoccaceae bacterium]|jgi:pyruvate dehydrogenase E2 component (dihydrolipoamide acetyltransferase)
MAIAVEMPKMSDTMEEGVLVAWLADEGQAVSAGDVIAQVETDKATMDLEVYDDGVLLKRVVAEGAAVPIGALIAVLGSAGESADAVLAQYGGDGAATAAPEPATAAPAAAAPAATTAPPATPAETPGVPAGYGGATAPVAAPAAAEAQAAAAQTTGPAHAAADDGGRVKASPLARRMAQDGGLDLATVVGTGPEGRVVKRDVEAALGGAAAPAAPAAPAAAPAPAAPTQAAPTAPVPAASAGTDVRITQMRKTIARRLAQSKFTAPHFYLTVEVDMARAAALRADLNAHAAAQSLGKVSVNDLVTKACAAALVRHPYVNASYLEDEGVIRQHAAAHVAIAVAMPEGLLTPVVRDANTKGLAQIAAETRDLATRARAGTLDPSEYAGSTFTTSNLGMFGISEFTAIINPPNACILAIGATRDVPVVKDGAVVPGQRMTLTLSCDHRVVDGATGAAFLADVKGLLEEPMRMLL